MDRIVHNDASEVFYLPSSAEDRAQVYAKALRAGQRTARNAQLNNKNPYLTALEELVPDLNQLSRESLGVLSIPTKMIAGSVSAGRTPAFANNFMPLLEDDTEFATKWQLLYESVVNDGLRDPIKVLEYMNHFYAIEGNKRISVMKVLDNPMIEAEVSRVIPKRSDAKEVVIYYEFMRFYDDTGIIDLTFSEEGSFNKLYELLGQTPGKKWDNELVMDLRAAYHHFCDALQGLNEDLSKITEGDAFLIYLQAFGFTEDSVRSDRIRANLARLRPELLTQVHDEPISLKMSSDGQKPSLIRQIMHGNPSQLNVCFINNRNPDVSGWTYWHELGKNEVDSTFERGVTTRMVNDVNPQDCLAAIEDAVKDGANVVFTTSPVLLDGAIKAAMKLPHARILNCSLLPVYNSVRSYYLRMYEAKFIMGVIAGAASDNNRIGYIADYPVYGIPASINAFALGARMTNPRARVYLEWSMVKDRMPEDELAAQDVHVICNRDIAAPAFQSTLFGLYSNADGRQQNLAMPVWQWGKLYVELLRRIQNGFWDTDMREAQAMNYWWGMDAGAIDVYYTQKLDPGTRRITDLLLAQLREGKLLPFAGQITAQSGEIMCRDGEALTPAQIMAMDYLCDNVIGSIPTNDMLKPEALAFVEQQGLRCTKAPDISEIKWAGASKP